MKPKKTNPRQTIKKSVRFDVLKRDSFKCQYCGATAPDVLLHIDHINPVSKGGTNDITNLITSCQPCNSGKSNKPLDSNLSVEKSRIQMEELQEQKSQIEMMLKWRLELNGIDNSIVESLAKYWNDSVLDYSINDHGILSLKKFLKNFSFEELCDAIDASVEQYLKYDDTGEVTQESVEASFKMIPRICAVKRKEEKTPGLSSVYYIRGILKNRFDKYHDPNTNWQIIKDIEFVIKSGVDKDELIEFAKSCRSHSEFEDFINGVTNG